MNEEFDSLTRVVQRPAQLGELQTQLVGAADFCATYLRCQLLLMEVPVFMSVLVSCSVNHVWL